MNHTIQREAILEELRHNHSHPTADELYQVLRKKVPQISLGTVYRNLEDMANRGLIRKVELAGRQKRFEGRLDHHYHLRCHACGAIVDLRGSAMDRIDRIFAETMRKLDCDTVYLEWGGLCPACRRKSNEILSQKEAVPEKEALADEK